MIDGAVVEHREHPVHRLAAIPQDSITAHLTRRQISPENIADIAAAIAGVEMPYTLDQSVDYPFRTFSSEGRFGDGSHPVLYSSLDTATCFDEVKYARRRELAPMPDGAAQPPIYVMMVRLDFSGLVMPLEGKADEYPQLISETPDGYPFCREVAKWVQALGAEALASQSARRPQGTCVPVFVRHTLAHPEALGRWRLRCEDGHVVYEEMPPA